jgi:integrative and conjugative element protein (TIGR02256 family)
LDNKINIVSASGPGVKARQTLIEFVYDKEHVDPFLEKQYNLSKGLNIYVGEWHSHPQSIPYPSKQDFKSFYERVLEWRNSQLIFLITGFINLTSENFYDQTVAISFKKDINDFTFVELIE